MLELMQIQYALNEARKSTPTDVGRRLTVWISGSQEFCNFDSDAEVIFVSKIGAGGVLTWFLDQINESPAQQSLPMQIDNKVALAVDAELIREQNEIG